MLVLRHRSLWISILVILMGYANVAAQNATTAGVIEVPNPTIINLAVEWFIQGDDNLNGVVTVEYRETGSTTWMQAMPLRRVPAGVAMAGPTWSWANKHSGSIFNLKPDTEYEIHLTLTDPDGGSAEQTVTGSTRPVPKVDGSCNIIDCPSGSNGVLSVQSGTANSPNVYLCSNGRAQYSYVDMSNKEWVYLEGLTFISSGTAISYSGAENCVIRRCTVECNGGNAAITAHVGAKNCYIADNLVTGPKTWNSSEFLNGGSPEGIRVTGPGNVICHNKVIGFTDGISAWESSYADDQWCLDFYNNDVYNSLDDAFEIDYIYHNCRVLRNRAINTCVLFSCQPSFGGPNYIMRNVAYNVVSVTHKFHNWCVGLTVLHNTFLKHGGGMNCFVDVFRPFERVYSRNNLGIGGPKGYSGVIENTGKPVHFDGFGVTNDFDYDITGTDLVPPSPPGVCVATRTEGCIAIVRTFGESAYTDYPFEPNGISTVHTNPAKQMTVTSANTFESAVFPADPATEYTSANLQLKSDAAAVDAALIIPNINDDYLGAGPDIGALEYGVTLPSYFYGPRPEGVDESNMSYTGTVGVLPSASTLRIVPSLSVRPNPFAKMATIFRPPSINNGQITLSIFDAGGNKVRSLFSGKISDNHSSTFYWDGKGDKANRLANGVYYIKLQTSGQMYSNRIMLLQ